jgi:hypothetical protein
MASPSPVVQPMPLAADPEEQMRNAPEPVAQSPSTFCPPTVHEPSISAPVPLTQLPSELGLLSERSCGREYFIEPPYPLWLCSVASLPDLLLAVATAAGRVRGPEVDPGLGADR